MTNLIPSATTILLHDNVDKGHIEVLLLKRNAKLTTHGGSWVFPGGKIDPEDFVSPAESFYHLDSASQIRSAKKAALREAKEEASVDLSREDLALCSTWLTPPSMPKRFDAWFFVTCVDSQAIQIDQGEIHDATWMSPYEALKQQAQGSMTLPPPTFLSLHYLSKYNDAAQAFEGMSRSPMHFKPKLAAVTGGFCSLYEDDTGYETGNVAASGKRHRLMMVNGQFNYIRDDI